MPKSDFVSVSSSCTLCPRRCGADRAAGRTGFCGAGGTLKAARAALHYWEEPCISGTAGRYSSVSRMRITQGAVAISAMHNGAVTKDTTSA